MTAIRPVTELTVERYRLDELPEAESNALRNRVETDAELRARLAELEGSNADLLRRYPSGPFVASVKARATATPGKARTPVLLLVPLSGVAVALIALVLSRAPAPRPGTASSGAAPQWTAAGDAGGDRLNGAGPALLVFANRGDGMVEQLQPGAMSRPGDVIRIAYQGGARSYGVILSIDGLGRVTRHLPLTGKNAAELRKSGASTLDIVYKLDEAPRGERFYFVTADQPFAVEQALAAARSPGLDPLLTDRLPLSAPFSQASFLLRKDRVK